MSRPKPGKYDLPERKKRAEEFRAFRKHFLFTQKKLASFTGIARRTVQQIEAGEITPTPETLAKFEKLRKKHEKAKRLEWT